MRKNKKKVSEIKVVTCVRLTSVNPYVRAAMIQPAIMEGRCMRMAYDHRLFYVLGGEGVVSTAEGESAVGPDTLLFFRPGYGYFFRGKLRVIVLNFDLTRAMEDRPAPLCPVPLASFAPEKLFDTTKAEGLPDAIRITEALRFREDLLNIVSCFHSGDEAADALTSALLKKVLAMLAADIAGKGTSAEILCDSVRHYLRVYVPQIKDNRDVAQHFGYHPVYLAQLFKSTTGENLHHAIMAERVRVAGGWLTQSDQTIDEIAFGAGFATRSHFCTCFKKMTGLSPTAYRKKHQPAR